MFWKIGEEDLGFGVGIGLGSQDGVVSRGVMAEDDFGVGRGLHTQTLCADGDPSVGADFDDGALAPDKRPPGTTRDGTENGAVFIFGGVPGLLGFHLEFAMEFVLVAVKTKGVDVRIGLMEVGDVFAGEVGGQAVLPVLMFAFDFAFGLRRGGVAKAHTVEAQGRSELSQSVGDMSEKEGVEIHVEL